MKRSAQPYFLLLSLLLITASCKKSKTTFVPPVYVAPTETEFSNPILTSGPDPWVIKKDSFYYYTHTSGDRIRMWRTKSMSKLGSAGDQTIWTKPSTGPNSNNVWAPEFHYLDGKWYTYYTAGSSSDHNTQRTFVLENTSADPWSGSWVDRGKVADPAADFFAIDATILDHNGSRYMIYSGHLSATDRDQRLYIARMSNPWTLSSSRVLISSPTLSWEKIGAPPGVNEGPEIIKGPTGKTFLVYSASGCWTDDYALGMLTLRDSGDPLNPADWIKTPSPVFVKAELNGAYGPGHNAFFKSPDGLEDWIIYHANPSAGLQCGNQRSPRIQKFTWNADGTPNFGQPAPLGTKMKRPSGEKD